MSFLPSVKNSDLTIIKAMLNQYNCIDLAICSQYNFSHKGCNIMTSTIQVRVDDDLKVKSDHLFHDLGTDTTSAIRMFLRQAVANNGFPFEIKRNIQNPYTVITEEEVLQKLEKSRISAERGEYKAADTVVSNMRKKYGL